MFKGPMDYLWDFHGIIFGKSFSVDSDALSGIYTIQRPNERSDLRSPFALCILVVFVSADPKDAIVKGGGSSFPLQPYSAALTDFNQIYQGVQAAPYLSGTSISAQQSVTLGTLNWAGSDVAIQPGNPGIIALPAIAGGMVVILPRIFDGTIVEWNDARLLQDNPFLANITSRIRIVRQGPTSGGTINVSKFLAQIDIQHGINPSPFSNSKVLQSVANSLLGKNAPAVRIMVGAIPYTIGYLNQLDGQDAITTAGSTVQSALIQHQDGSFVGWSMEAVNIAVRSISTDTAQTSSVQDSNLIAYDSPAPGAYPLAVISNFVIKPTNISMNVMETIATLKFLWIFIQNPLYATNYTYGSIANTAAGLKTLNYLKTITYPDGVTPIYGQSICDIDVDGTYKNPCLHGHCIDPYPFQQPFQEPTPLIIPGFVSKIQITLFLLALVIVLGFSYLIVTRRNEPDVKALSPLCCLYILVGCLVGCVAVLTQGLSTSDAVCRANIVLPAVAFGMIFMVAIVEGVLAWHMFTAANIQPALATFDQSSDTIWDCAAPASDTDTANQEFGGLIGFNAIILALCIAMGLLTRKASQKFDESKKVGIVISISTLFVVLDLGVNFGIPHTTQSMFYIRRLFDSITIFLITTATPVILFSAVLGWGNGHHGSNLSHTKSEVDSAHLDQNDGLVRTFMFHVGMKLNRPASLWKSTVFLIMPDLDMLITLGEGNNGTYTFSQSNIKIQEKTTKAAKAKTEECIELLLGTAKIAYLVEFPHKEKMDEFRTLRSQSGIKKSSLGNSLTLTTATATSRSEGKSSQAGLSVPNR
ncbi:hypothetical protein HDU79_008043 [Rhizoclosmatium sp. JEL0117]|nr:hypothetical protein HDU79_008043 [Rhizoclosmatium sp. JEL0117]